MPEDEEKVRKGDRLLNKRFSKYYGKNFNAIRPANTAVEKPWVSSNSSVT